MEDSHTPKIIASYSDFDETMQFNNWATSMDVLILSRCKSDTAKTIFLTYNKNVSQSDTTNPDLFLYLPWDPPGVKDFDALYFNLPAVPYKLYNSTQKIHLKAMNGAFVCNDQALKNIVIANRYRALDWETFCLITLGNDKVAIQSSDYHYISAKQDKQSEITANKEKIGPWETFIVIKMGDLFAFKAANGKYLTVDEKSFQLFARGDSIGRQEKFEMIITQ